MPNALECPECGKPSWATECDTCPVCSASLRGALIYRVIPQCPEVPKCPPPARAALNQSDLREALSSVADAWDDLVRARSIVPALGDAACGVVSYSAPPFYRQWGLNLATVIFERPLSEPDARRVHTAAHSVNEGHILRLHAILDVSGLLQTPLDKADPLQRKIRLLKSLRNEIAHGRRLCDPFHKNQRIVLREILEVFYSDEQTAQAPLLADERRAVERNRDAGAPFEWPLSILGTLMHLTSATQEFISSFIEA